MMMFGRSAADTPPSDNPSNAPNTPIENRRHFISRFWRMEFTGPGIIQNPTSQEKHSPPDGRGASLLSSFPIANVAGNDGKNLIRPRVITPHWGQGSILDRNAPRP